MSGEEGLRCSNVILDDVQAIEDEPIRVFGQSKILLVDSRFGPFHQINPQAAVDAPPNGAGPGNQIPDIGALDRRRDDQEDRSGTRAVGIRSEEHTSELQSLMRISYAVFCLKTTNKTTQTIHISRTR